MALALGCAFGAAADDQSPNPFEQAPKLRSATTEEARQQTFDWLGQTNVDPPTLKQATELWASAGDARGVELLELVVETLALADERAKSLVQQCQAPQTAATAPDVAWLADETTPQFERHHLRLYYGRWLAQRDLYDESLAQLAGLTPEQVVDPATLLFFQAVNHHRLLDREPGLAALKRLQHDVASSPERYTSLASLMEADLKSLEDESLDHIARRMDDVRRRLDLGRPDKKTREVEDGVIASLDKMIEQLEQQQQQQQQSSSGGSSQPQMPANDSRIMGGSGPGETNKRDVGDPGDWGGLPPKTREEALQQIGKDFPAHYRDVVEQYFRKLASERSQAQGE